jgi:hemolysin activation/secretion protein
MNTRPRPTAGCHALVKRLNLNGFMAVAACVLGIAAIAHAQAPVVQTPIELRFDITRYAVEGNSLLPESEVEAIVSRFTGRQRDFGDVQRALEALELAYRERGYSAVQVYLPEQDLEKGTVRLRVIEARISRLQIEGNKFFDEANVRASLPSLAAGRTPNANEVAKNLRIVNESPAKQTSVTLRAGEKEGDVEALVDVSDEDPKKWFATLDNTGNKQSGYYRAGLGFQNSNLFGRDHAITLQYVTSPEKPKTLSIYSVGYHMPFYSLGASMDLIYGYSDSDVGATQTPTGPLKFSGRGHVMGMRYNHQFDRIGSYDHRLTGAIDYRKYENACSLGVFGPEGCGTAAATYNLAPVWLTYTGHINRERSQFSYYATAATNISGGSKGDTAALGAARFGAKANYFVYRAGMNFMHALEGDWQFRARLDGQYTNEVLVPPEQFGIGGMNSVRGFLERQHADDRGHNASMEIYTPDLAANFNWGNWNMRGLGFVDSGRTSRVNPQPSEVVRHGISSWGGGLRLSRDKSFSLRVDVAQILNESPPREKNHWRGTFGAVLSF